MKVEIEFEGDTLDVKVAGVEVMRVPSRIEVPHLTDDDDAATVVLDNSTDREIAYLYSLLEAIASNDEAMRVLDKHILNDLRVSDRVREATGRLTLREGDASVR